jgi:ketosteroid isomerase-like protein
MLHRLPLSLFLLFAAPIVGPSLHAPGAAWADQPAAADEKAIRELIRKSDEGERIKWTEDGIFASGLTPKPLVGRKEAQESRPKLEAIGKQRPNHKTKTTVERLVVAKAGDLAYEYSNFRMEWDGPDGRRTGFNCSLLRV